MAKLFSTMTFTIWLTCDCNTIHTNYLQEAFFNRPKWLFIADISSLSYSCLLVENETLQSNSHETPGITKFFFEGEKKLHFSQGLFNNGLVPGSENKREARRPTESSARLFLSSSHPAHLPHLPTEHIFSLQVHRLPTTQSQMLKKWRFDLPAKFWRLINRMH